MNSILLEPRPQNLPVEAFGMYEFHHNKLPFSNVKQFAHTQHKNIEEEISNSEEREEVNKTDIAKRSDLETKEVPIQFGFGVGAPAPRG